MDYRSNQPTASCGAPGIRSVKSQGDISWKGHHIYLSEILAGERVGLRQATDRIFDIYFAAVRLAQLDTYEKKLNHLPRTPKKRRNDKN